MLPSICIGFSIQFRDLGVAPACSMSIPGRKSALVLNTLGVRNVILKNAGSLRRGVERWPLPLLLLVVFLFLYLSLFQLPRTPIFTGGDEDLFLLNATRMLNG